MHYTGEPGAQGEEMALLQRHKLMPLCSASSNAAAPQSAAWKEGEQMNRLFFVT